jgi:hypothetical protein
MDIMLHNGKRYVCTTRLPNITGKYGPATDGSQTKVNLEIDFEVDVFEDTINGVRLVWLMDAKQIYVSTEHSLKRGNRNSYIIENVEIPKFEKWEKLLLEGGKLNIRAELDGFFSAVIETDHRLDTSIMAIFARGGALPIKTGSAYPLSVGNRISIVIKYGKDFSFAGIIIYGIFFENDLETDKIDDYQIKIESEKLAKIKYTNGGEEHIETAAIFRVNNNQIEWTAGLAEDIEKTIIIGENEEFSPTVYEWNMFLYITKDALVRSENFVKLSQLERNGVFKPSWDCFKSPKPRIASITAKEIVEGEWIIKTRKLLIDIEFENIDLSDWTAGRKAPHAEIVLEERGSKARTNYIIVTDAFPVEAKSINRNNIVFEVKKNLWINRSQFEHKNIYIFINIKDCIGNVKYLGGLLQSSEADYEKLDSIIPVTITDNGIYTSLQYNASSDTVGFIYKINADYLL